MEQRALRERHRGDQAKNPQRAKFRRSELERHCGERWAKSGYKKCRDGTREERADGRSRERRSRPSLLCHLVTVQSCNDGGSFSGKIDENRGRRAVVLRIIVDAS